MQDSRAPDLWYSLRLKKLRSNPKLTAMSSSRRFFATSAAYSSVPACSSLTCEALRIVFYKRTELQMPA